MVELRPHSHNNLNSHSISTLWMEVVEKEKLFGNYRKRENYLEVVEKRENYLEVIGKKETTIFKLYKTIGKL